MELNERNLDLFVIFFVGKAEKVLLQYGTGKDHLDVRKQFLTAGPCIL